MINLIIFDWKRTLFDPDKKVLINGAVELLEFILSKNTPLILIGKGGDDMQLEVDKLRVRKYFKEIIFAEGEKDPKVFAPHVSKDNPKETAFIGDRIRSELLIGNQLGVTTIWIKQGKFATELPENKYQKPDHTISSLSECLGLLRTLIS